MTAHVVRAAVAVCIAVGAVACAGPDVKDDEQYRAPVYRTGSNLPAGRESGETANREISDADRRALEHLQSRTRQPPAGLSK